MDRADVWRTVDAERAGLADLVATLTDAELDAPSLCTEWTVREVVAHLTLTDVGFRTLLAEGLRYGGRVNVITRETARRRAAELTTAELVQRLREMVGSRGHVLGTSHLDPLVDVLVHGQDIAVPLGRSHPMPAWAAATAAQRVATMGYWYPKRRPLRGLRLEADDVDWSWGTGDLVRGPISVLLLVLAGRRARMDELTGAGRELLVA
jgi:uncharacterized protein (TIGR03083 family)